MPKRSDIKRVLLLGAGPIVIGQACEFDYSGTQACKALKEEGCEVILVNSNPATIMTDPELADATYIEPVKAEFVAKIIERERPDALLPTMGGQTALNCALDLARLGILEQYNVKLIGASREAIDKAEDRQRFREAMTKIGLEMPVSEVAHNLEQALAIQAKIGFPTIIRPSFTLGGSGGGIAYNKEEFIEICNRGFRLSPTSELQIEESWLGCKEYELEVVRDSKDNCIIVCSIENVDAMGVHTGDSITVAPAQTLTDKEYQRMRNAAIAIMREIGVDTGGSNVQFGVHPDTGKMVIIEMNPRVSRSSALASKATGFPIARIATKLALGYTLDELKNEITQGATPASFEPTLDYVVTKIPRFCFEKFPQTEPRLTTQMKSVGEAMAIGRNFQESLQKALRSLETGISGLDEILVQENLDGDWEDNLARELKNPGPDRLRYVADALRQGWTIEHIYKLSGIDPWFLEQIQEIIHTEQQISQHDFSALTAEHLNSYKRLGFSDARLAKLLKKNEQEIRGLRQQLGIRPVFKRIDSCAAEFPTSTAYFYSSYETFCEAVPSTNRKILILGGGPNRIGQGIEFDYCCVHTVQALREAGFETLLINCNPETVSTDYDTADRLYFEPLTLEDVLEVIQLEKPEGVIVQNGGQTPLKLARYLDQLGIPILGTSFQSIDCAEDREKFSELIHQLGLRQPQSATARTPEEALIKAEMIGYPVMVRPSYVLGGSAMRTVYNSHELKDYLHRALSVSEDSPLLLDRFLESAIEVDVDAVSDGENVVIAGIMEHIEQAGIHSGDSSSTLPPHSLSTVIQNELGVQVKKIAQALKVVGLINTQFAIQGEDIYLLEVNPRASRTVPFIAKATGIPWVKIAARCMIGQSIAFQKCPSFMMPAYFAVKQSVFPFEKFPGVDIILGPEMRSTGEVMGIAKRFGEAFAKAQLSTGMPLPTAGKAFLSVRNEDKPGIAEIARQLLELGFSLLATSGTAAVLQAAGLQCEVVNKVWEGRPNILDAIINQEVAFIINTSKGRKSNTDSSSMRRQAISHKICYATTLAGAKAACMAMRYRNDLRPVKLQELYPAFYKPKE